MVLTGAGSYLTLATIYCPLFKVKHVVHYAEQFLGGKRRLFDLEICPLRVKIVVAGRDANAATSLRTHVVCTGRAHS